MDNQESITPIPIPYVQRQEPLRKFPHPTGCMDSCKFLTKKEHERLAYLEDGHMRLTILQSTLWMEFCRLKRLSDQVDIQKHAYASAIDTIVTRALDRGKIQDISTASTERSE